ncbi:hypothetical protein Tco_1026857 [Tanacetum coccineum]
MRGASKGYTRVGIPLFPTMLVQGPILQGEGSTISVESHHTPLDKAAFTSVDVVYGGATTTISSIDAGQGGGNIPKSSTMPHDSPLPGGHTPGSDEGNMTLHELTVLCTKLSNKVDSLEIELKQTKQTYGVALTKLIKKGRSIIEDIDQDAGVTLVQINAEDQGRFEDENDTQVLADASRIHTYTRRRRAVSTGSGKLSTASRLISTAEELVSIVGASMLVSTAGMVQESYSFTRANKDKAQKLQEEIDAAERQRMAQLHQAAQGFIDVEWDDVLARVATDEDFVQQLQAGEKCSEEDLPMNLVELVNKRKKFFAQQRAEAKRNKPMTPAQQKEYMSNYIKNQEGGYSIKQLKSLSFEQLEVQRLKRAGQEVLEEPVKRRKIGEASGSGEEQSAKKEKDLSEEELQKLLVIIPVEEVFVEALQVKYPIIDYEVYIEGSRKYWKIIRVGNHTEAYQIFTGILKKFDKDDMVKL